MEEGECGFVAGFRGSLGSGWRRLQWGECRGLGMREGRGKEAHVLKLVNSSRCFGLRGEEDGQSRITFCLSSESMDKKSASWTLIGRKVWRILVVRRLGWRLGLEASESVLSEAQRLFPLHMNP